MQKSKRSRIANIVLKKSKVRRFTQIWRNKVGRFFDNCKDLLQYLKQDCIAQKDKKNTGTEKNPKPDNTHNHLTYNNSVMEKRVFSVSASGSTGYHKWKKKRILTLALKYIKILISDRT